MSYLITKQSLFLVIVLACQYPVLIAHGQSEDRDVVLNTLKPHILAEAPDGSLPLELRRTKSYGYSLFNLDAMTTICQLLSTPTDNLWTYQTPDGRGIRQGSAYLHPYLRLGDWSICETPIGVFPIGVFVYRLVTFQMTPVPGTYS